MFWSVRRHGPTSRCSSRAGTRPTSGRRRSGCATTRAGFPLVEVGSTYYALPTQRTTRLWAQRAPEGFTFDAKAFSLLTCHPTRVTAFPKDLRGGSRPMPRVSTSMTPIPRPSSRSGNAS
ncbi:DUF72 domain-containing protein [Actinoallomurus liliacearum]|uniref:DUF72 domain-containing protein n=1 Tax=Actinoallomurus liliacearum TaxID=1080073 RepID=UPI003CD0B9E5